jgi:hypothetical protein
MAKLIPMPLTAVQKMRMLARQYEGDLIMVVCHFGLACKIKTRRCTIAFPVLWETIESETFAALCCMINLLILENLDEKPSNAGRNDCNN